MKIQTITICSSASFYQKVIEIEKELLDLGFKVEVPISARKMEESGDFSMTGKKVWVEDPTLFYKKTELMDAHFKKVVDGDAVLVVNLDKGNVKGYIGGNVLMEMTLAYYLKKPIYVWQSIDKEHPFYEEVMGVNVEFLDHDLSKIRQ